MECHTTNKIQEGRAEVEKGKEEDGEYCMGHAKLYTEIIVREKSFLIIAHNSEPSASARKVQQWKPTD